MNDLERRHQTYYAIVPVPKHLWDAVGKRKVVKSLKTRNRDETRRRLPAVLAEIHQAIAKAKSAPHSPASQGAIAVALSLVPKFTDANPKFVVDSELRLTARDKVGDAIDSIADHMLGFDSDETVVSHEVV